MYLRAIGYQVSEKVLPSSENKAIAKGESDFSAERWGDLFYKACMGALQ